MIDDVEAEIITLEAKKAVEEETKRLRDGLAALLSDARGAEGPAKVSATKRLKIFGKISDPVIATRLALMNRDQRRAYLARKKASAAKVRAKASRKER